MLNTRVALRVLVDGDVSAPGAANCKPARVPRVPENPTFCGVHHGVCVWCKMSNCKKSRIQRSSANYGCMLGSDGKT
jgi:hypothetical protein